VAKQGDVIVTLADIDAFAQRIPEGQRAGFFNSPQRIDTTITSMLVEKQLAAEARKAGLDQDPAVKARIDLAVDEALSGIRLDDLRKNIKLPDFDALAREEYVGHKEKYETRGRVDVKHILISTKSHADEEARKIADDVEEQARAHPDQFDALIDKYSEDPSKDTNHGLMADASGSHYVPAFANAARALHKPGEISPVVQTPYGYHILKLVERVEAKPQKFADVREKIVDDLRSKYIENAVKDHTDEIRNRPMTANPDLVASLRTRYGTLPPIPQEAAQPKNPAAMPGTSPQH
jgi:peptidyl-prolyl cis-trans isomerase C